MLRVRVCTAHMMIGFLGSPCPYPYNSVNKEPFFSRFYLNIGALFRNCQRISKMGGFPPKFIIRVGMTQVLVIGRGYLSENRVPVNPQVTYPKSCG